MPPQPPVGPIPNENADRLLPPAHINRGAGPTIGIIIILLLLIVGAFYFWGAHLNAQSNRADQLPLIPASDSTTTIISTTTMR